MAYGIVIYVLHEFNSFCYYRCRSCMVKLFPALHI